MHAESQSDTDCKVYTDYVFHRHSGSSKTIYYRCSDKRCPARLNYKIDRKIFEWKNDHLHDNFHKDAFSPNAMPAEELLLYSDHLPTTPILVRKDCQSDLQLFAASFNPQPENNKAPFI